jgi:hypothetical protein
MVLCIASGGAVAKLALAAFTIAWTHSVEQVAWEEDLRIEGDRLIVLEARIKGSGAGMEVPEGAVLRDGFWHYRPDLPPLPELELANSGATADWRLCAGGSCKPLGSFVPRPGDAYLLTACPRGAAAATDEQVAR